MSTLHATLPWLQLVLSILLVTVILLQPSSAGAGGAFGGADDVAPFRTKRGFEKVLFYFTIVVGILFIVSAAAVVFLK